MTSSIKKKSNGTREMLAKAERKPKERAKPMSVFEKAIVGEYCKPIDEKIRKELKKAESSLRKVHGYLKDLAKEGVQVEANALKISVPEEGTADIKAVFNLSYGKEMIEKTHIEDAVKAYTKPKE